MGSAFSAASRLVSPSLQFSTSSFFKYLLPLVENQCEEQLLLKLSG